MSTKKNLTAAQKKKLAAEEVAKLKTEGNGSEDKVTEGNEDKGTEVTGSEDKGDEGDVTGSEDEGTDVEEGAEREEHISLSETTRILIIGESDNALLNSVATRIGLFTEYTLVGSHDKELRDAGRYIKEVISQLTKASNSDFLVTITSLLDYVGDQMKDNADDTVWAEHRPMRAFGAVVNPQTLFISILMRLGDKGTRVKELSQINATALREVFGEVKSELLIQSIND